MIDLLLEELRRSFKPRNVHVLFVGESPPIGGTFFYKGNSNLSRYTQIAFSKTFDVVFESERDFLKSFQRLDCYLDDLCLSAVNHLPKPERRRCRRNGVESLAERIGVISPRAVVTVMRGIVPYVEKAAQRAGVKEALMFSVPFPTMGNQQRYVAELVEVLRELQEATILTRRLPVQ